MNALHRACVFAAGACLVIITLIISLWCILPLTWARVLNKAGSSGIGSLCGFRRPPESFGGCGDDPASRIDAALEDWSGATAFAGGTLDL
jgi:hypothetical protein